MKWTVVLGRLETDWATCQIEVEADKEIDAWHAAQAVIKADREKDDDCLAFEFMELDSLGEIRVCAITPKREVADIQEV
jgi:hypothetical protein